MRLQPRYGVHRTLFSWNDDFVTPLTLRTVRWLTALAFAGFVVSRVIERLAPGTFLVGLGLLAGLAAALAMVMALSSRAQRLLTDHERKLDEYQRSQRSAALSRSYAILSALVVGAGLYVILALDWDWPLPSSRDTLHDLAFGAVLLTSLLPVTILAWTLDLADDPEALEGGES